MHPGQSSALASFPLQAVLVVTTEQRLILVLIMQIGLDEKLQGEVIIAFVFPGWGIALLENPSSCTTTNLFFPLGFFQVKKPLSQVVTMSS